LPQTPETVPAAATPRFRWRKAALRLGASALVLAVLVALLNQGELWEHLRRFAREHPGAWALALAGFLGLHAVGALKWRLFLRLAGARIGVLDALRFYGLGLFANLCLPSLIGGDVLRAGLALGVAREKDAVVLGSLVDRLADLVALGCLVIVGGLASSGAHAELLASDVRGGGALGAFFAVLALGVVGAAILLRTAVIRRMPLAVARHLLGVRRALAAARSRPARAAAAFSLCLAVQTGFVLVNAGLGRAVGIDLGLDLWLLLWPLAKIAAMLPISLGGLGVREAAFAVLTAPYGVEGEAAVAQSLVWQSVLVSGGLLAGAFALATRAARRGSG
jgi:glycosyltransferase 2 family protein